LCQHELATFYQTGTFGFPFFLRVDSVIRYFSLDFLRRSRLTKAVWLLICAVCWLPLQVYAQFDIFKPNAQDPEPWEEAKLSLPPFPAPASLIPFRVSVSPHQYAIAGGSITYKRDDGVTRFVLVITTAGGAVNVTYEGIRCAMGEHRTLAQPGLRHAQSGSNCGKAIFTGNIPS
jgi:hypothetical protein